MYIRNRKMNTLKTTKNSLHYHTQQPTNENDHSKTLYKGLAQCIIGD